MVLPHDMIWGEIWRPPSLAPKHWQSRRIRMLSLLSLRAVTKGWAQPGARPGQGARLPWQLCSRVAGADH